MLFELLAKKELYSYSLCENYMQNPTKFIPTANDVAFYACCRMQGTFDDKCRRNHGSFARSSRSNIDC